MYNFFSFMILKVVFLDSYQTNNLNGVNSFFRCLYYFQWFYCVTIVTFLPTAQPSEDLLACNILSIWQQHAWSFVINSSFSCFSFSSCKINIFIVKFLKIYIINNKINVLSSRESSRLIEERYPIKLMKINFFLLKGGNSLSKNYYFKSWIEITQMLTSSFGGNASPLIYFIFISIKYSVISSTCALSKTVSPSRPKAAI